MKMSSLRQKTSTFSKRSQILWHQFRGFVTGPQMGGGNDGGGLWERLGYFKNYSGISLTQRAPKTNRTGSVGVNLLAFGVRLEKLQRNPGPRSTAQPMCVLMGTAHIQVSVHLFPAVGASPSLLSLVPKQATASLILYAPFLFSLWFCF